MLFLRSPCEASSDAVQLAETATASPDGEKCEKYGTLGFADLLCHDDSARRNILHDKWYRE